MASEGGTEAIISWNVTNWITVGLMAATAFFLVGVFQRWYAARQGA